MFCMPRLSYEINVDIGGIFLQKTSKYILGGELDWFVDEKFCTATPP
jgi:hypothetical protein